MSLPLLTTKFMLRPLPQTLVPRLRLLEQLQHGRQQNHHLSLIAAPAGFGKTTLASAWVHQLQQTTTTICAWLTLDEGDNDSARFFDYLIAALQHAEAMLGQALRSLLGAANMPPVNVLATLLINDVVNADRDFVLVLDDYHTIINPEIHEALTFLLEHAPAQLHIVLTTRQEPPLPLARWRARNLVTEVSPIHLRFTSTESGTFVTQTLGVTLPQTTLALLDSKTEGWAAGLQLATLSMRDKTDVAAFVATFGGDNRHVGDYLMSDVLAHLPPALHDFLLHTCILDQLTAPLCNALTGHDDTQQQLETLSQANLFVFPMDEQRAWYRYHALFAEFLRTHYLPQHLSPDEQAAQHQKASAWFASAQLWPDAVHHALTYAQMTNDMTLPAHTIAGATPTLLQNGAFATVLHWLQALPKAVIQAYPQLLLYKGWVLLLMGRFEEVTACIQKLQRRPPTEAHLRGQFVGLRAAMLLQQEEDHKALKLAQEALTLLPEAELFFRSALMSVLGDAQEAVGDREGATETYRLVQHTSEQLGHIFVASYAVVSRALVLELQGQLPEAIAICQRAITQYVDNQGRPLPAASVIHLQLAYLLYQQHALAEAQQTLDTGLKLCRQLELTSYIIGGLQVQALLHSANSNPTMGITTLDEARGLAVQNNQTSEVAEIDALIAILHLERGDIAPAKRWAGTARLSLSAEPDVNREIAYNAYLHLLLAQGKLAKAKKLLATLEQFIQAHSYHGALIQVRLWRVALCRIKNDTPGALRYLTQAVHLAAPGGYIQPFVEQGELIGDLLNSVASEAPAFVHDVQVALGISCPEAETASDNSPPTLIEALSARELDVLHLVAAGLPNREIGAQLFIATGTVRKHLEHIYGKLAVRNRTEAVNRARELNLMP